MIKRVIIWGLLIAVVVVSFILFFPRTYAVQPFEVRKGTRYWELNTGSKIGYTKIESRLKEKKNPIIYLHGGPGGKVSDQVISTLEPLSSSGHDLYFYDQIGSGHSKRLENIAEYSVSRHKNDLEEIIGEIGAEKVIIIGHSWGSMLATQYLQDHPGRVEKLILTGPGPILPIDRSLMKVLPPEHLKLKAPEYSNKRGNQKAYNLRSRLILKWAYLFKTKLATDKEADDFFTFLNEELNKSTNCKMEEAEEYEGGGGYYAHIMTVKSFSEVENKKGQMREIQTPALIIRGQCDNQKWGFTKEYLNLLPNSRVEIVEHSGHDLIRGNKEKYFELISEFLQAN
jgi:proline iminopeptidase